MQTQPPSTSTATTTTKTSTKAGALAAPATPAPLPSPALTLANVQRMRHPWCCSLTPSTRWRRWRRWRRQTRRRRRRTRCPRQPTNSSRSAHSCGPCRRCQNDGSTTANIWWRSIQSGHLYQRIRRLLQVLCSKQDARLPGVGGTKITQGR